METIKNYLETMFATIPDSPQSRKAKQELLSMMEDKYNELKESGMPENEIIGTIISEFGNKEDLMEFLGQSSNDTALEVIRDIPNNQNVANRRIISMDEALKYISDVSASRSTLGLGVFMCILAPIGPILASGLGNIFFLSLFSGIFDALGVAVLFLFVAIGVGFILVSCSKSKAWEFLEKEPCALALDAEPGVQNELMEHQENKTFMLALGVLLCIISVVPVTFFGIISFIDFFTEALGPALIFPLVGAGVFCILNSTRTTSPCETLLELKNK